LFVFVLNGTLATISQQKLSCWNLTTSQEVFSRNYTEQRSELDYNISRILNFKLLAPIDKPYLLSSFTTLDLNDFKSHFYTQYQTQNRLQKKTLPT
jgi:hypothetical protein